MRRDRVESELAEVHELRSEPRSARAREVLERLLERGGALAVAASAELIGSAALRELAPQLPAAFKRFAPPEGAIDPGCRAKTQIAVALQRLDWDDATFFLQGALLVVPEKVWGGSIDAAAELRSACALGLAPLFDPRIPATLARLLADPEWVVRVNAARALGASGLAEAEALLRFKAHLGDPEPQVATEVLTALLLLAPRTAPDFLVELLRGTPAVAGLQRSIVAGHSRSGPSCTSCGGDSATEPTRSDAAALALGQSRRDDAFAILRAWSDGLPAERQDVALLAIAMLRSPEAIDHLIALVAHARVDVAKPAIAALALHRDDDALRARLEAAVAARHSKTLTQALRAAFST